MSASSLSSVNDEEMPPQGRIRFVRDRNNPLHDLDVEEFKIRFCFSKEGVMELLRTLGPALEPATNRNKSVSAINQLLITLRYYATGAFQQLIGDTFNIQKPTVCRIIHRATHLIAMQSGQLIKMPTAEEAQQVTLDFYAIAGFPHVIGTIDCTHIKIISPGGNRAELYRNRKGFFSINVQVVADAKLKIRHVIARWPGSVHDSTIFNDCPLKADLEHGRYGNNFLLGDSGYPCRKYLLTPLLNTHTPAEEAYNIAHIRTRNTIERCFGVLKRRFPCLHVGMTLKLDHVLPVIIACCTLYNLAININDPNPPEEYPFNDDYIAINAANVAAVAGQNDIIRRTLVNTVFQQ